MTPLDVDFHMWATLALIAIAIVLYSLERLPLELTSMGLVAALLVFFQLFPVAAPDGANLLGPRQLLAGFAEPALIAVLALLVIGQAIVHTGALERPARWLATIRHHPVAAIAIALAAVLSISAVLNNTPVVVIFIPIMTALADRMRRTVSGVMLPLSFAAILGGMTTLIGSSTNLLVLSAMVDLGLEPLGFFDFTVPGLLLAGVGLAYVLLVVPRLLPDRAPLARTIVGGNGKQFIAQIAVGPDSSLAGARAVAGLFPSLPEMTVRMIQRGEHPLLPPFEDVALRPGDIIIVAATRKALTDALASRPELMPEAANGGPRPAPAGEGSALGPEQSLAEVVVAPASRMIGRNLAQIGFHYQSHCVVLGIQRRSRMIRSPMDEIRLEAGDVLLLLGARRDLLALRANPDVLLLEWLTRELPAPVHARRALLIFAAVVGLAASDLVPIVVAAVAGATTMVAGGCLNLRQAGRALDRRVILMVGATLGLGTALQVTGGAAYIAHILVTLLGGLSVAVTLSAFFLLVAGFTNIISNNATAVLFTPIAIKTAIELGVDPTVFVFAVIFAANCSFATPIGYQTNLLVMGPGHYRFSDFLRAGTPLIFIIWLTFSLFAPWYYGLV